MNGDQVCVMIFIVISISFNVCIKKSFDINPLENHCSKHSFIHNSFIGTHACTVPYGNFNLNLCIKNILIIVKTDCRKPLKSLCYVFGTHHIFLICHCKNFI